MRISNQPHPDDASNDLEFPPSRSINVLNRKPLAVTNLFANVRQDGLTYREISSLMGNTRKLPNGEVV
ncbi:hypothetical protein E6Q11_00080 [Candidatus Dojkabacteria bacterium]|uniref:Uncharacterized protein n=1 Tax=Candidatus Dojkabacteria bacterium TaxID=2099670 RepID=A0A5C7JBJ0_9BACT|nr:MAG: hypothetical protein E6Q11_00080 [Candidatus Dojkabacteria bacterium]